MAAFELPPDPGAPDREGGGAPAVVHADPAVPQWRSEDLLAGASEARIAHGDSLYRLRITMLGKLILTK